LAIYLCVKEGIAQQYGKCFDPGVFSPYAGVAQQYIYYYTRNVENNWHNERECSIIYTGGGLCV